MSTFEIQNEILTQVKFWGRLLLFDLIYGLVLFQLIVQIYSHTSEPLKIPCLVILGFLGLIWILPSPGNKGKRNYHRFYFILTRNRQTYHPISFYEIEEELPLASILLNDEEDTETRWCEVQIK